MTRHSIALLALLASLPVAATDVVLVGTFDTKAAILAIDAGAPKTVRVGQRHAGVTVIAVDKDGATVEVDGKRRLLRRGQAFSAGPAGPASQTITLTAGAGGHFTAEGKINGGAVRFLVDTGATAIAIPASDAERLGIDYRKGRRGTTLTAGGPTPAFGVTLDTVQVGSIELRNIDAIVIEQGLGVALLGNTFLNRVDMRREGQIMTLTRRH